MQNETEHGVRNVQLFRTHRGSASQYSVEKPALLAFSLDYTLVSDDVFRGVERSEYRSSDRNRCVSQLGTGIEAATPYGNFGGRFWFSWFDGCRIQEVDYNPYWAWEFHDWNVRTEIGWIAYTFPGRSPRSTYEMYGKVSWDTVVTPYFYYGLDCKEGDWGSWFELGVSYDLRLGDIEAIRQIPIARDMTITPSVALGIDHRYLHNFSMKRDDARPSTRFANLLWGFEASYDLNAALDIPRDYGSMAIGGFMNFSQALRDDVISDEFFGGLRLSYAW